MFPDGSAREASGGFIGIEAAELMRQRATVAKFKQDHASEYRGLVSATVALKRAHQQLEEAKAAARSLPTGLPMNDLLDEVEREARIALKEPLTAPTAPQIAQAGDVASTPEKPAKKAEKSS